MSEQSKISFSCPHCGRAMTVATEHAGKSGKCNGCKNVVTVPTALDEVDLSADVLSTDSTMSSCVRCGSLLATDAVVCMNCGFDKRVGMTAKSKTRSSSESNRSREKIEKDLSNIEKSNKFLPIIIVATGGSTLAKYAGLFSIGFLPIWFGLLLTLFMLGVFVWQITRVSALRRELDGM